MNLSDLILQAVTEAEMPLKTTQVTKLVKPQAGRVATPKAVATTLDALAAAGRLNRITAGKTPLFTKLGLESVAEAMLRSLVRGAKQPPQAGKLRAKLPAALQPHFEAALATLVAKDEAFVLPGARQLVHASKPKPSELLNPAKRNALKKIFAELNAVRGKPVTLEDFAAWLDGEASASPQAPKTVAEPDEALLKQWYEQDRLRSSTMMIPIPRTYERYAAWAGGRGGLPDAQIIRKLIESLYKKGSVLLEPCERPQDLPEHERAMLVPMSLGPPGYSWCWIA